MNIELNIEPSSSEYHPDKEVNRLEVYESLLLDPQSALWREVLHRKGRRSSKPSTPAAVPNGKKTEAGVFDIDSEEEEEEAAPKETGRDVWSGGG